AVDDDALAVVADISIAVSGPPTIVPGTTVDYVITIANAGPSLARALDFEDVPDASQPVPSGLAATGFIQSVLAPPDAVCVNVPVVSTGGQAGIAPDCSIPLLAPNETRSFTVRLLIPPDVLVGAPFTSSFSLVDSAALNATGVNDPTPGDHVATTS